MREEFEPMIAEIKKQILQEAAQMRIMNKKIPVTGQRHILPMEDREIEIVYYKARQKHAPLILGFHGGGFLFGGCAMNDGLWSAIRDELQVNVASVEYRKSPEYMYQAALDDAYDAAVYLKEHAGQFEFDPEDMWVMGCSAGAALATTAALYAKQKGNPMFSNQILMYPFLDSDTDPMEKGPGSLSGPMMYIFNEMHCKPEETRLPLVSPVFASPGELQGMPNTILALAENDNLKAEGKTYGELLKKAGVQVAEAEYKDMPHGFFESGFGKISEEEMAFLGEEVIAMIKDGRIPQASREALEFVKEHIRYRKKSI